MPPRRRVQSSERDAMFRLPVAQTYAPEEFAHRAHDTHTQWKHKHTGARMHACERAQAVPQAAQSEQPESVGPQQGLTFLTSTYL